MPRVEHEPWCKNHSDEEFIKGNGAGVCKTNMIHFGPLADFGNEELQRGFLSADRVGDCDVEVYIDYLSESGGGLMNADAVRCVREAVAESPVEFLAALDQLIETLGSDVPAKYEPAPKLTPTSA